MRSLIQGRRLRSQRRIFLLILPLLLGTFADLAAAVKPISRYIHRAWLKEDELPQTTVQAVVQTRDGYLWLGTQEGLVRFDGVSFTVFNKKNTLEFRHNDTRALCEGRDGRLWIGTANGLLSYKDGHFSTHFSGRSATSDFVSVLFEDASETLWVGTYGGGLNRLKDGQFTYLTAGDGLAADVVTAIWLDRRGTAWIGTAYGLDRIQDGQITAYTSQNGLPNDFVTAIRETADGNLWIGTRGGLVRMKDGQFLVHTIRDGLTSDIITCLYEDRQSSLWVGTEGKGINRWADGQFSSFTVKDGLTDDYVLSFCQDREGLLWVGTYAGGLNRLWEGKFATYSVRDGLPVKEVRTILERRDGSVWIGTREGGVACLRDEKITSYSTRDGLPDNTVRALFEDRDDSLWLGTNNGLTCYRDGRFINYSRRDGLAHDFVRAIAQDHEGRMWVGTSGGGLHEFRQGRLINFRDKGIPETVIRCLMVGRDGSLWIGSNDGLTRWRDNQATHYSADAGLPLEPVYVVYEDEERTIWIGTYGGGLCRFKDGRFSRYTTREGMFHDVVYQILEDGEGDLWMSCNAGIYRVSKQSLNDFADGKTRGIQCTSYGTADGMRTSECNGNAQPSGWKTRDGRLWFPTAEGVVVIDSQRIEQNSLPPLVNLESAVVDGRAYDLLKPAVAPPGSGRMEFHYAGLSFIAPQRVRFKYRLEGFDPDWVEAGARRDAFYTNLPPRRYRFRVMACNNDGLWSVTEAALAIRLKPHFYQTTWFYGLAVLAVVTAGYGVHKRRVAQLQARERELAGLVAEKTKDLADSKRKLEIANKELERLANVDSLTGVSNRRNFMNILDIEWRRAERQGQPLALIMADVDYFKAFNDNYGHQAGDQCLKALAAVLKETVTRAGDLVGRYGGEEFIIILPATGLSGAAAVAERLRAKIELLKIEHKHSSVCANVTVSFGVAATVPIKGRSQELLIKAADQALFQAKNEGRNRCKIQTP